MCFKQDPLSLFKKLQMGYFGFERERLEPSVLPWRQHSWCHLVSFVMYNYGAKLKEHCFKIPQDICD